MRQKRFDKLVAAMVSAAVMVSAVPGAFAAPVQAAAVQLDAQIPTRDEMLQAKNLGMRPASGSITDWFWFDGGIHASVNHFNGNVAVESRFADMGLTYNSQLQYYSDGMGNNMAFYYMQRITKVDNDTYLYRDEYGAQYYFFRDTDGLFRNTIGNFYYEIEPTETGYNLHFGRHIARYDADGRLMRMNFNNPSPSSAEVNYFDNGAVGRVYRSSVASSYWFTYYQNTGAIPQLQKVEAGGFGGALVCTFDYNDSGYLTQINYANGETTSYTYNSDGLLTNVSSSTEGKSLEFTYQKINGMNKVANVKEVSEDGSITDSVQFAYGINQTIIIDKNGAVQVVSFNENGEVVR